jgi:hypothetical protein
MKSAMEIGSGRRALIAGVTIAALLTAMLISALAVQAGKKHYEGPILDTASGEIFFQVQRTAEGRRIRGFHFDRVPMTCSSGTFILHPFLGLDGMKVRERRFKYNDFTSGPKPVFFVHLKGRLRGRGRASGTIQVTRQFDNCDSGTLEWKAKH